MVRHILGPAAAYLINRSVTIITIDLVVIRKQQTYPFS